MIWTESHYINEKINKIQFNSIHATLKKIDKRTEREGERRERERERGGAGEKGERRKGGRRKEEREREEAGREEEISLFLSLSFIWAHDYEKQPLITHVYSLVIIVNVVIEKAWNRIANARGINFKNPLSRAKLLQTENEKSFAYCKNFLLMLSKKKDGYDSFIFDGESKSSQFLTNYKKLNCRFKIKIQGKIIYS